MAALDLVLALFFCVFVFISASTEAPVCLGATPSPDHEQFFMRESYHWGLKADMLWVLQPVWVRCAVCIHAFGFGPAYLFFAYVFATNQAARYSTLVIAVCLSKLYAGSVCAPLPRLLTPSPLHPSGSLPHVLQLYMLGNLLDPDHSPASPTLFVLQSCSYMLIPLTAMVRAALLQCGASQKGEKRA